MKTELKKGDKVRAINIEKLPNNDIAPPLTLGGTYEVKEVIETKGGHHHIDVGIVSKVNFVTCHATKIQIPRGDKIHWCHPSRFEKV